MCGFYPYQGKDSDLERYYKNTVASYNFKINDDK